MPELVGTSAAFQKNSYETKNIHPAFNLPAQIKRQIYCLLSQFRSPKTFTITTTHHPYHSILHLATKSIIVRYHHQKKKNST